MLAQLDPQQGFDRATLVHGAIAFGRIGQRRADHIVPRDASKPLIDLVSSEDRQEVVLKGGHISVAAGANASKRMWPKLDAWLAERST